MSRNKNWKRQAKRILGNCLVYEKKECLGCKEKELCFKNFGYTGYTPTELSIRIIEELCRYTNNNDF